MGIDRSDKAGDDPLAQLERAFITEFLQGRGYGLSTLRDLPATQANALMKEASLYASGRLSEVESRAHLVDELHHTPQPMPRGTRERKP